MNLHAISYYNIGPFKEQVLTCFFVNGKYLIKAPIGAGKSFLFFDGPMFGLYKHANRNMLNAQSKEGFIKILFEANDELYLLIRNLKAGKSKDSCSSTRYRVDGEIENGELIIDNWREKNKYGILAKNVDIEDIVKDLHMKLEELSFKNETDLQQMLQSMLTPKEVFLNTVFLMQDSANIFQLAPAERLNVLKNVFNLLSIDEGKEVIAEKKREIYYKLKATADTSKYDDRLKQLLATYEETFTNLLDFKDYLGLKEYIDKNEYHDFISEINFIKEKVTITDFSLTNFPAHLVTDLEGWLATHLKHYQEREHRKENIEKEKEKVFSHNETANKSITDNQKQIEIIDQKISSLDPQKIVALKTQKQGLQKEQEAIDKDMPKEAFKAFYLKHKGDLDVSLQIDAHVADMAFFLHGLITFGKGANEKIQNFDLQIKNHELRMSQQKTSSEQEIKNIEEKIIDLKEQNTRLGEKMIIFEKDEEKQATFDCQKIGSNCPFIKVINKQHFDALEDQKKKFVEERKLLEKKIKETEEILTQKKKELKEISSGNEIIKNIEALKKEQESLQTIITQVKNFLNEIGYKTLQEKFQIYQESEQKIKSLDKEISSLEEALQQIEGLKSQKEKHIAQIDAEKRHLDQNAVQLASCERELGEITKDLQGLQPERLHAIEKLTITMKEISRDLTVLIDEFAGIQIQVKGLQEEEKMLGELYNIFAKELLLLVLQDSLPVLNDIINNYLTQVVDYQIKLELIKTASDKLELEATITDDKGVREIKSLSGGQLVILKIVRMLSISSYIHSPILFLDETINNLDVETVGKVADMLEDFVQTREMKLYTVTHSQQIQQMDIRDEVIEIGN